ncbi:TRI33-like protein, partial [Mya arenaria]
MPYGVGSSDWQSGLRSFVTTLLSDSWLANTRTGFLELQYFPITPPVAVCHTPESTGSTEPCNSSVHLTSDLIHDFACSPCKDDGLNNEAHFFCDECKKYYCNNCVQLHNKLFRTHSVLGRQDVSKWVGYAGLSPIEICDKHGDKKLELLCEDHDKLCCPICVSLTHRLQGITKKRTHNKQSLKYSGKKILAEIQSLRKNVIDKFDDIEKKTKDILENQLHEADDFLQDDIDKCTKLTDKLKTYLNTIQSQQDDNISYIAYKKCKDKMSDAESLLQELSIKPDTTLTFQADPRIEQFLS